METEKVYTRVIVESDVPKSLIKQVLSKENLEQFKSEITDLLKSETDDSSTFTITVIHNGKEY